jgi:hypothetical protein
LKCEAEAQFSQEPASPCSGLQSDYDYLMRVDNFTSTGPITAIEFWGYWLDDFGEPVDPPIDYGFNFFFYAADGAGKIDSSAVIHSRNFWTWYGGSGSSRPPTVTDTGKVSPEGAPVVKYSIASWTKSPGPVDFVGDGWLNINGFSNPIFYWVKSPGGDKAHVVTPDFARAAGDLAFCLVAGEGEPEHTEAVQLAQEPEEFEPLPSDPYFAPFKPLKAPVTRSLLLKKGDRLAICGDSITEQKLYSRIMETYLTVCVPELEITVRQYGWGGEVAPFFHHRMESDVLRFNPTIATTCYGMNDHRYQSYKAEVGRTYRESSQAIIRLFKDNDVRVVQGSPGAIGRMPPWLKQSIGTSTDLNLSLLELRNIDVRLALQEQVAFADVFVPMLVEGFNAAQRYGSDYMVSGKDGVHPDWAGHLVMAYVFLKAMGLDGDIGTVTVDLAAGGATASSGHRVLSTQEDEVQLESERYPFCATGELDKDSSIRSGMTLVPFNEELNRFILVVRNGTADRYKVIWGDTAKSYAAAELAEGVNLAADFHVNPFSEAFDSVDDAVAKKQAYETKQIKSLFHGEEGKADMDMTVALTEKTREPMARAIQSAFGPVRHTIRIEVETPAP